MKIISGKIFDIDNVDNNKSSWMLIGDIKCDPLCSYTTGDLIQYFFRLHYLSFKILKTETRRRVVLSLLSNIIKILSTTYLSTFSPGVIGSKIFGSRLKMVFKLLIVNQT